MNIDWSSALFGGVVVGIPASIAANILTPIVMDWFGTSKGWAFSFWRRAEIKQYRLIRNFRDGTKDVHLWAIETTLGLVFTGLVLILIFAQAQNPMMTEFWHDSGTESYVRLALNFVTVLGVSSLYIGVSRLQRIIHRFNSFDEYERIILNKYGDAVRD